MEETKQLKITGSKTLFYKELTSLAMPIALQNLMLALVGASDALMLGRLSQDAVSAVSLANQISFIMNLFIASIAGGCGALTAQYFGKNDRNAVKKLMSMGIMMSFGVSLIFFFAAYFYPEKLMAIYTSDAALIRLGSEYLRVVGFSYLFAGITQIYLLIMKTTGRAVMSAVIGIMTVFIDMAIDFFLIYGIAGFPRMEIKGCAVSTVAVEISALAVCIIDSYRKDHTHPNIASLFKIYKTLYRDFIKISIPMLLSALAWGVGYSLHSLIMGHQNNDAIAAASIVSVILELIVCICKGLSNGAAIMVGKLLGQNRMEEAKKCGAKLCKIAIYCGMVNMLLLFVFGPICSRIFILTEQAQRYLVQMMLVLAVYLFAYSLNTIIVCGIFPAGGDAAYDAKSVFFSMWCFSLPLALLGTFVFDWSVMTVYILVMCDEIVKLPWLYPHYKKYIWLKNLTKENTD